jgi:AraC family transcriptional regulator of adaptative response/methylated-DNA-[protein]-cysteine methyltransferase
MPQARKLEHGGDRRFTTESARWEAVIGRDPLARDAFVYAVRSTGVYCRPGCASRRPRRDNVEFFANAAQAGRAGYRACKRCQPQAADPRSELVRRVCAFLDAHAGESVTLEAIAAHVHVSPFHLQRVFKAVLGMTPREYQEARRIERFKASLERGATVTAAMHDAGFGSSSRLYESAGRRLGMKPSAYSRRGAGVRIEFALLESPLGTVLIAATERGLCKVALGDDGARLEAELRAQFSAAQVEPSAGGLQRYAARIAGYLRGGDETLDLPRDVQATAFQQRVWEALRAIPAGETRSYGQIAAAIGSPRAHRAVGSACAANPLALVVPCHRALSAAGGLGGFAWGTERKRALLALEKRRSGAERGQSRASSRPRVEKSLAPE